MEEIAQSSTGCSNCGDPAFIESTFCANCGYPENGSEEEQRNYRLKINSRKRLLVDAEKKIKNAKNLLMILAGIMVIYGTIIYFVNADLATLIASIIIAIVYLGLTAWADKNPFGAILTAFIIYLTLWALDIIVDPSYIFKGIIIRIFIISAFIKGIQSAREAKVLIQQVNLFKHGQPVG